MSLRWVTNAIRGCGFAKFDFPIRAQLRSQNGTENANTTSFILGISYSREPEIEEGLA